MVSRTPSATPPSARADRGPAAGKATAAAAGKAAGKAAARADKGGDRPRRRLSVDERREQLIAVALELFSRRPPEEVSIDDIAAAAGASRPLVYHYFPGKQALYEESLRRAGRELAARFEEPAEGPLSERLYRVMGRYLDFVQSHGPGFAALLRGGSVAASAGTSAVIDEVRQAAHEQILSHLAVPSPSAGLRLTVRAWIANAEITSLEWLAERSLPLERLQLQLVQEFVASLTLTAAREPALAVEMAGFFAGERPDGPTGRLVRDLAGLFTVPGIAEAVTALAVVPPPAPPEPAAEPGPAGPDPA
ncbi:TetR/AcrR family transcriptional regulator [Kitasatospora sp. CM 4170]|uniref:TetR/AcrR family transcriptional regulator n=1 Tax=Kitasatospora aburaviensis TaxID=67265 RepID=A0ABW1ES05_9ACTN|nr:TetR/AcrR family transcriptional regulator [Kitasatospora sp. CM 4170]WNM48783.1 TetR/AcrR family transcriptional regulator [Kitasatospora sp. CM 4170]